MTSIELTSPTTKFSSFNIRTNRKIHDELVSQREKDLKYIHELQEILESHGIEIPPPPESPVTKYGPEQPLGNHMEDGSLDSLTKALSHITPHMNIPNVDVQFKDLSFWGIVPKTRIPTVGSTFRDLLLCGAGPKQRIDILKNLTGRIASKKMTLVMGPPGCGKSSFLKALAGQLYIGNNKLDGQITYNGDETSSNKFRLPKIADYIDEKDQHAPTLTVWETLEFAWLVSSNGHHSYGVAANEESAKELDKQDSFRTKVNNITQLLGLMGCANTIVGNGMLRGVSGGQKRRVTVGEMMVPPKGLKFMDAVSNGLDSSTTYDIFRSLKLATQTLGTTACVSLLQPAPEVFNLFDEVILFSEGQIIYHGPTTEVLSYFEDLGYICPPTVDLADFLQELPTPEGIRFIDEAHKNSAPRGTNKLSEVYKNSSIHQEMLREMEDSSKLHSNFTWPKFAVESYATSTFNCLTYCLGRQIKLTIRDSTFLISRFMQCILVGAITGSLFNNTPNDDVQTLSGMLFFSVLFSVLSSMALLPIIFEQRQVFYKHSRAMFYPTSAFTIAQTLVLVPVQIIETIIFSSIVYWSVGMSAKNDGGRFLTFLCIIFAFNLCSTQYIRLVASFMPSPVTAQPLSGVGLVLMVLFSGYIIPKSNIPPGWTWFYWLNPLAWALKSVTVNEYLAPDYDWSVCMDDSCTVQKRFGDVYLESRGNPTEQEWVWYGFAVLIGEFFALVLATAAALAFLRVEPTPPPPPIVDETSSTHDSENNNGGNEVEIPFEPMTFAFKDIWYTVKLKGGEELDLLKGVSGYFEPGTMTALMGSSGAGKTTLLDVLAGRKNTGVIKGKICVNGKEVDEQFYKRMIGYVEQFDTLSPHDTAREAVEFSAALRLPRDTPIETRQEWVKSVLTMLELTPLENTMVGDQLSGGMSFEQKKRLSIAVELAANPAILFLDEPTTGLDSRAAQVVIRCIRRVAASGRSIVCTIHQPSTYIFNSFDSLLLLRRGGQTVYNGALGDNNCEHLVQYFESAPGVTPIRNHQNPASWMLEVIGAGTSGVKQNITDFHVFYKQSALCQEVENKVNANINIKPVQDENDTNKHLSLSSILELSRPPKNKFNSSYSTQFYWLMKRSILSYWRSPSYNFVRMMISIVIALIFASTYANQNYTSDVDVISRCAVMYITCLFIGVVAMMTVQPVVFGERPTFYREQFSDFYDVGLYTLSTTLVELPYLLFSSILFVIPFFFIVGFDKDGVAEKFFFYWLFQGLYMCTLVFFGHFYCALMPSEASSQVVSGMTSTFLTLFCGFMIPSQSIPTFWLFIYWINPLHYALEGLFTTQFHDDDTKIKLFNGGETTAREYVGDVFEEWSFKHRWYDFAALIIFIFCLRIGTYLCLRYLRHDKR
mmetsp:Transcript_24221/g.24835  ORF Transcript_24221/g.24835 Transcript_24221/m.24835 type:complete len:1388 (-) Transcript_24221:477-4640(-)